MERVTRRDVRSGPAIRFGHAGRLLLAGIGIVITVGAAGLSAYSRDAQPASVVLHSPAAGASGDEAGMLLGWRGPRKGVEYIVFVAPHPIDGRSLEDLLADPTVHRTTTTRTSLPLRAIARGESGTTDWSWTVAEKGPSGNHRLAEPSTFRSFRTFEAGAPSRLLIEEAGRGSLPTATPAAGTTIELTNGYRFDPLAAPPAIPAGLLAAPLHDGETGAFLVQFKGPIRAEQREALVAEGAALVTYVPNNTFVVRMTPDARARVTALPFVRWVGAYEPAFKLSHQPAMQSITGPGRLTVLLYPDADLGVARTALAAMGGKVTEATDSGRNKLLKVEMDMGRVMELARRGDVAWIEPTLELHTMNAAAQWVVQTNISNDRRVWTMGLHGEGQVVHTSDSGIRTSHNAFRDAGVPITTWGEYPAHRKVIAYQPSVLSGVVFGDASGASYHGTHTAGSIVGDDSPYAANANDGMALKAKIWFTDAGALTNSITAPGDLNLLFQPPYDGNAGGAARVSSNSWGGDAAGAYTVNSMAADQFMWDHKDFLVNFSNGNAGPQPGSVGAPATMKNGISSGACANGANAMTPADFSSQGPAADGRLKPTIMSPGTGLVPELSGIQSASGANDTGYASLQGTSMSCPTVTGAVLLIRQYLTEGWYPTGVKTPANAIVPSGALLKAMAIASTDNDMITPIPNNVVGWGRIKLDNILYFPGDAAQTALVDQSGGLLTGDFVDYTVEVTAASTPLKIALCWFDKEGSPAAARQLVNDLDLEVTDPTGVVTYLGNVLQSGESLPGGLRDTLNVEECVRRTTPLTGSWTIRVIARNVPFGPQPFALAVSGALSGNRGVVQLDRTRYGAADQVDIRVEDLNAAGPVSVSITSSTETTAETVVLSGANGVFTGTIATTALEAASGDNALSVSDGDDITVTYADADPAGAVVVAAVADFTGPLITGVGGSGTDISHEVTWTTDKPGTSRVYYGLTPALELSADLDADLVTAHRFTLNGLQAETTYYFDVESTDQAGNTTRDDAGGEHYRFSTTRAGDILLLIGDSATFPRTDLYRSAFATYGWDASVVTDAAAEFVAVGNRTHGLRSKTAVLWQAGYEQYPAVPDGTRDSLAAYLDGGGRFSICTHDMAWSFSEASSGFSTPARIAWMNAYMHVSYIEDPATWPINLGVSGDPISGDYAAGVMYTPQRAGGAGDEIALVPGGGTGSYIWSDTDATTDNIALRWQANAPSGNAADAVWGGTPTKVVTNCYEWAQINDAAAREDILDKTLVWLIGHDHPDVVVTAPNGGEVVTGNTVNVAWTETPYGGTSIAARAIHYTSDGGATWTLVTASPGASPYAWDVSALPNSPNYRVRVSVSDDAAPALRGADASDADFTLDRSGGDARGPAVVAGSIDSDPNPMDNRNDATLTATLTDAATGNADVVAAEWSYGPAPAAPGAGLAMSGSFDAPTVTVSATVPQDQVAPGVRKFWIRGRDAAGNWGNATAREFTVNGTPTSGLPDGVSPVVASLDQNAPNPFNPVTTIRFALPRTAPTELTIFDVQGRKVRTLVSDVLGAGAQSATWDGRSDANVTMPSGIYFYTLVSGDYRATRKMVMAK
jgi:hypothetical protein